jgi:hypothetical protein
MECARLFMPRVAMAPNFVIIIQTDPAKLCMALDAFENMD